eukprot:10524596-Ditylum_brightwellii.AAC.3
MPKFAIETQNNPNVTSEKDKQNSPNIGVKNVSRDPFNNVRSRENTQRLSMEISHEYTKNLTWEAKIDKLKRLINTEKLETTTNLDELTYLGSYEGKDFERKNAMEVQDEPKIELEVNQKKVIVNSKNGTKTSENYPENQSHKIKPKIEPKNQPEKEEVVDKPKATNI